MHELQQHAVRMAVHDALDRACRIIADRIGALLWRRRELRRIGNELPRDRVIRIGRIDQPCECRWDRDRITGGNRFECRSISRMDKAGGVKLLDAAQGFGWGAHGGPWPTPIVRVRRCANCVRAHRAGSARHCFPFAFGIGRVAESERR